MSLHKQKQLKLSMQRILAGKKIFRSIFTRKSNEQIISELEQEITQAESDYEKIQFICDIITVVIGYIEIDKFKDAKMKSFYEVMGYVGGTELDYLKVHHDIWDR